MVRCIHVCTGPKNAHHDPIEMMVVRNGVDIFRQPDDTILLADGVEWMVLAAAYGVDTFDEVREHLDRKGGDYYGSGDRLVCPTCFNTIVWRV